MCSLLWAFIDLVVIGFFISFLKFFFIFSIKSMLPSLLFFCLSLLSQDHNPELPESNHRPLPRQNMFHLQRSQGPRLAVLCCQRLGPGHGLPVSSKHITISQVFPWQLGTPATNSRTRSWAWVGSTRCCSTKKKNGSHLGEATRLR